MTDPAYPKNPSAPISRSTPLLLLPPPLTMGHVAHPKPKTCDKRTTAADPPQAIKALVGHDPSALPCPILPPQHQLHRPKTTHAIPLDISQARSLSVAPPTNIRDPTERKLSFDPVKCIGSGTSRARTPQELHNVTAASQSIFLAFKWFQQSWSSNTKKQAHRVGSASGWPRRA